MIFDNVSDYSFHSSFRDFEQNMHHGRDLVPMARCHAILLDLYLGFVDIWLYIRLFVQKRNHPTDASTGLHEISGIFG
jgi:hypothetical protein